MWDLLAATSSATINILFTHDKINKSFPSPSLSAECFCLALAYSLSFLKEYSEIQWVTGTWGLESKSDVLGLCLFHKYWVIVCLNY